MTQPTFDYQKLRGKIREVCHTEGTFATIIGVGRVTLSERLNNKSEFSQREIWNACRILGLRAGDIPLYFFTKEVQESEQASVP